MAKNKKIPERVVELRFDKNPWQDEKARWSASLYVAGNRTDSCGRCSSKNEALGEIVSRHLEQFNLKIKNV